ncbi:MAG: S-layer homology domain-containing protein, partial [Acutalibacter sp.]
MNKSKFLKKSLAMLLALMLVVAMIPLSASAAETPVISQITVNDVVATGSGDSYTAEIADPGDGAVEVAVTLKNGVGSINKGTEDTGKNQYVITLSAEEKDAKSVSFDVYDTDNNKTQSVTVTYTITAKSTDTSVKSVSVDGMYDVSVDGNAYTVIVPYGSTADSAKVVLNNDKAKVTGATESDGAYTVTSLTIGTASSFTVEAESGNKTVYTVKLVSAKAFTEFSVAGERKAAEIGLVTEGVTGKTVKVFMPYGTEKDDNNKFQFTPTFTKAYEGAKIEAQKTDTSYVELVSGEKVELSDFADLSSNDIEDVTVTLKVTYSEGKTEDWTLTFDVPTNDPVAAIKGLSVGSYAATIEGTNITLTLPKSLRVATGTITLDTTSEVAIVGANLNNGSAGIATISNVDLTKDSYTLRVTAAAAEGTDPKQVVDYTLTIKTAAVENAKLNTMTLEDTKGNQYEASIDQSKGTVTFEVPYSVKEKSGVKDWKLFYTISSGSTVTELKTSGFKLSDNENFIPAGDSDDGFTGANATATTSIVVTTPDLDSKTYTIVFKNAPAKTGSTLGTVELTSVDEFDKMNDSNTIKATVSGKKITVKVPYSQWSNFDEAVVATTLPEGAKLYYVKDDKTLNAVDTLNENNDTVTNKLPSIAGASGICPDYSSEKTPLTLVVASEALTVDDGVTTLTDVQKNTNAGKYSIYELAVLKQDARKTAELTSFSVYDATSKKTVTGTVSGTDITITLPYYFTDATRGSKLYLDYSVRGGESLKANDTSSTPLKDLTLKKDGAVDVSNSIEVTYNATDKKLAINSNSFDKITATSEDGSTLSVEYTLTVKVADANTEAKLNSVSIKGVTATPDSSNKVSIVLPFGTEVTSLVPTFNVSTNAYVKYNSSVVKEGDSFNFLTDKTFVVYSENGVNTATYTVSVTTGDQFSDISESDWYYNNVMRAVDLGILSGYSDGTFKPNNN